VRPRQVAGNWGDVLKPSAEPGPTTERRAPIRNDEQGWIATCIRFGVFSSNARTGSRERGGSVINISPRGHVVTLINTCTVEPATLAIGVLALGS